MQLKKNKNVIFQDLGLIDYKECWDYQERLFKKVINKKIAKRKNPDIITPNYLLFCEHPNVYTLGKSGDEKHLLLNERSLKNINAKFYKINRGGDITYHGPGQIVGYPILDLDNFFTDIHKYLRLLEEVIIRTLNDYGIKAGRYKGYTGVWIDAGIPGKERKICAIGVRTSRWVTMHGFAFNINTNLEYFKYIIPCGINDKKVTSMQMELNKKINVKDIKKSLLTHFETVFKMNVKLSNANNKIHT